MSDQEPCGVCEECLEGIRCRELPPEHACYLCGCEVDEDEAIAAANFVDALGPENEWAQANLVHCQTEPNQVLADGRVIVCPDCVPPTTPNAAEVLEGIACKLCRCSAGMHVHDQTGVACLNHAMFTDCPGYVPMGPTQAQPR